MTNASKQDHLSRVRVAIVDMCTELAALVAQAERLARRLTELSLFVAENDSSPKLRAMRAQVDELHDLVNGGKQ